MNPVATAALLGQMRWFLLLTVSCMPGCTQLPDDTTDMSVANRHVGELPPWAQYRDVNLCPNGHIQLLIIYPEGEYPDELRLPAGKGPFVLLWAIDGEPSRDCTDEDPERRWEALFVPIRTDGDCADLYQRVIGKKHAWHSGELSAEYSRFLRTRRKRVARRPRLPDRAWQPTDRGAVWR